MRLSYLPSPMGSSLFLFFPFILLFFFRLLAYCMSAGGSFSCLSSFLFLFSFNFFFAIIIIVVIVIVIAIIIIICCCC
ncbi:hypothetical protein, unlikely [Trypanosoma brucei brucei TREU927]|uniref:Uncharacterized protein n=1 Tax=Trypanosoma brucei brucei (strain 927/4 GUTat10.1) TaxID=185431 RepID=Q38E44_TRYB2|nr:hypothetical protein, unlikely [Trypanosoma brucei brucei TREU927]EAN76926.1 hypothetical protein, unlikely [Trypanosoma brucei brucei TREU927]